MSHLAAGACDDELCDLALARTAGLGQSRRSRPPQSVSAPHPTADTPTTFLLRTDGPQADPEERLNDQRGRSARSLARRRNGRTAPGRSRKLSNSSECSFRMIVLASSSLRPGNRTTAFRAASSFGATTTNLLVSVDSLCRTISTSTSQASQDRTSLFVMPDAGCCRWYLNRRHVWPAVIAGQKLVVLLSWCAARRLLVHA